VVLDSRFAYRCKLRPNGQGGFVATFPDVPEALTEGATRQEALINAADALHAALLGRLGEATQ
jgi:antitoxin HicB